MTERKRPKFHSLLLTRVRLLTDDSVGLTFLIPEELREDYQFLPGQYLTLKAELDGHSVRRSYSISSGTDAPGRLEVGVRQVDKGLFSTFACGLSAGVFIDVMTPQGQFVIDNEAMQATADSAVAHPQLFLLAAGSGITPCLSMMKSLLASDPGCRITLLFGNRNYASIMFLDDIKALKDRYTEQLAVIHVLSQERMDSPLLQGRINSQKMTSFCEAGLLTPADWDAAYCCGPEAMLDDVMPWLRQAGLSEQQIHRELFLVADDGSSDRQSGSLQSSTSQTESDAIGASADNTKDSVTAVIRVDGAERLVMMQGTTETVLQAADRAGLDLPFSCAGGMCCTCRCKVLEGEVTMDANYSLASWEVDDGYVLACQARPVGNRLLLDFDAT